MTGVGPAEVAPQRQGQAVQALLVPEFISSPDHYIGITSGGDFPGSSVVKTPCFQCMGHGFDLRSEN